MRQTCALIYQIIKANVLGCTLAVWRMQGDDGGRGVRPGHGACSVVPAYGGTRGNISLPWRTRCATPASGRASVGAIAYSDVRAALCPPCGFQFLDMTPGAN